MNVYSSKFRHDMDYKAAFKDEVSLLIKNKMPLPWRIKAVQDITDAYVESIKELPDSNQLTELANYILMDDLANKLSDKVAKTEYPVLGQEQLQLRDNREQVKAELSGYTSNKKHMLNGRKKKYCNGGNVS
ncbi:hypothetical protein Dtox_3891 [Desulfofarcimen acetoxidans DSM 771]|uniref:Uncharacterized protein n=1 Tax=Desulfofarcimen acetoxidans (strain ATCC 49208 / DSM 771 / KCTC 5769 / VKM B-1644 / 5575) TaxID=485916 RepID=C8VXV6_DESAS|nr:hypothetical protein [Desulfofarcimen acetoxidans]ACV64585.1 hypothetical protein Dtox_3891 [Desulfofarcimen acetoxidans DSM 771]